MVIVKLNFIISFLSLCYPDNNSRTATSHWSTCPASSRTYSWTGTVCRALTPSKSYPSWWTPFAGTTWKVCCRRFKSSLSVGDEGRVWIWDESCFFVFLVCLKEECTISFLRLIAVLFGDDSEEGRRKYLIKRLEYYSYKSIMWSLSGLAVSGTSNTSLLWSTVTCTRCTASPSPEVSTTAVTKPLPRLPMIW